MLTVTFYSFRGGVGRTMALANAAVHLAREGLKVFLIDFDLEAPGLSLMPEMQAAKPCETPGLLDYLRAGLEDRDLPELETLCYETVLSVRMREEQATKGQIHLLPAGTNTGESRQHDLAHLHLERLYESQSRALVIDALKVQIEQQYQPDYLLVDSRTGFTDVGGICTVHLADLLVIVSGLNRQNVDGTSLVVRNLFQVRKNFAENVLFVISPVPIGEEQLKAERLKAAGKQFAAAMDKDSERSSEFVTIPYHPQVALTEECFVLGHPSSPLAGAFRGLAEAIRDRNPDDLGKRYAKLFQRGQRGEQRAVAEIADLAQKPGAPRDAWMLSAAIKLAANKFEDAQALLEKNPNHVENDPEALDLLGRVIAAQAKTKSGKKADGLFAQAYEKYETALKIKRDFHEALNNWGNALSAQAEKKSGKEADKLFALAGKRYEAALKIKRDFHEALNNWGNALSAQAKTKSGAEADRLFALAGEKYEAAQKIEREYHEVHNDWEVALPESAKGSGTDDEDPWSKFDY